LKKIILLALILLTISCSNDDEEASSIDQPTFNVNLLLKGWRYDALKINGIYYNYEHNPNCNNDFFGFLNRPGQAYQFIETTFTNDYCTNNSATLDWKIKKDTLYFYIGNQVVLTYKVLALTTTSFTFSFENDIDQNGTIDTIEVSASPYDPYNMFGNN
jgi:hypothetical protein